MRMPIVVGLASILVACQNLPTSPRAGVAETGGVFGDDGIDHGIVIAGFDQSRAGEISFRSIDDDHRAAPIAVSTGLSGQRSHCQIDQ